LAKSTPILINCFTDGLPLCGAPAATLWHSDAVEVGPSTPSRSEAGDRRAAARLKGASLTAAAVWKFRRQELDGEACPTAGFDRPAA
jgi:hypothetical protein